MNRRARTGLIFGKFMPLHSGHVAMIRHGASRCEKLIVLVAAHEGEPIPGELRLEWVRETFRNEANIEAAYLLYLVEELPDSSEPSRSVSRLWASRLKELFPAVEVIFSSEEYGPWVAEYMGIDHVSFDAPRKESPVSASAIRQDPGKYWEYIPEPVRPYFTKKICIYGPESTGKSTLTEYLARRFNTALVPEVARDYIGERHVVAGDIPVIAELHARAINEGLRRARGVLFVDTDIITTAIYSEFYFKHVPVFPQWTLEANRFHHHLLLDIDVPWVADPNHRHGGHIREFFFEWFRKELEIRGLPYTVISGSWEERQNRAVDTVRALVTGLV